MNVAEGSEATAAKLSQRRAEVLRERRFARDGVVRARVAERQPKGVERQASDQRALRMPGAGAVTRFELGKQDLRPPAVEGVNRKRETDRGEVNADLVQPSGEGAAFQEGVSGNMPDDLEACQGRFSVFVGDDDAAVGLIRLERQIDLAGFVHAAGDEGEINLLDFAASELSGQSALGVERPSVHDNAGGVAVDPVDGSELLIGIKMLVTDQGVVYGDGAGSGDTDQSRGFVDDEDFGVLMEDSNVRNTAFVSGHDSNVPRRGVEGAVEGSGDGERGGVNN